MKWATRAIVLVAAAIAGVGGFFWWAGTHTLQSLVHENQALQQAISNLQQEEVVAYLRVVPDAPGQTITEPHLRVEVQEPSGPEKLPQPQTYVVFGEEVFLEGAVVKFDNQLVSDGKARALLLWRRIYGDEERPAEGAQLWPDQPKVPARYESAFSEVPARVSQQFWAKVWQLAHDPEQQQQQGIVAVYGSSVSIRPRANTLYMVLFTAQGQLYLRPAAHAPVADSAR
ncbi:MAG: hypothetical protein E1N59_1210 [Puniceicoccaceae bacterium 5H]|nr:MAG: hypothetical protein E1N59_1210 [Puniceicoccaceae bacterium 5H]